VLTAGGDQIFPRGLPVGVVQKVVRDPERENFIDVIVNPAAHLDRLDEVLVITSTQPRFSPEQQQDLAASEALKGPEAAAIKEQQKASQIMAERLPGLTDSSPPTANSAPGPGSPQPGANPPTPAPIPEQGPPRLLRPLHPDRFTPASAPEMAPGANPDSKPDAKPGQQPEPQKTEPRRNP
jgi:rod shape-determining protein MreC